MKLPPFDSRRPAFCGGAAYRFACSSRPFGHPTLFATCLTAFLICIGLEGAGLSQEVAHARRNEPRRILFGDDDTNATIDQAGRCYMTTDREISKFRLKNDELGVPVFYRLVSADRTSLDQDSLSNWQVAHGNAVEFPTPEPGNYKLQMSVGQPSGRRTMYSLDYNVSYPFLKWVRHLLVVVSSGGCLTVGLLFIGGIIRTNRRLERRVRLRTAEVIDAHQEKQRLEFELLQAQKMESLGTLAAGMAHDFNNSLCAISSNAELALLSLHHEPRRVQRHVEEVMAAAHQAAELTHSLLTFAGKSPPKREARILQEVVDNSLRMIRSAVPATIRIDLDFDQQPLWCRIDETQLNQVIINLVMNARDAMPDGGELKLSLARAMSHLPQGSSSEAMPYDAILQVSDSGIGMDAATLTRVFEPFFTTKSRHKGTGLGMSMVHSIVSAHEGEITLDSQANKGTVVEIRLPSCAPQLANNRAEKNRLMSLKKLKGTVVVADDEQRVRKTLVSVFESLGLTVITAADGQQLVDRAREQLDQLVLIATDLEMPKVDGETAINEIRKIAPHVPAILFTGQATDPDVESEHTVFMRKPFQLAAILERAKELVAPIVEANPPAPHFAQQESDRSTDEKSADFDVYANEE